MTYEEKLNNWKQKLLDAQADELNQVAEEIAAEMWADIPDQNTVLSTMSVLTNHPKWDRKTNPFMRLATDKNKADNKAVL